jgi:uncharacterized membrane protein YfcA
VPSAITLLLVTLGVFTALFTAFWVRELVRRGEWGWPRPYLWFVGFVTDFLDTLGISSFATTTTLVRINRAVPDEKIPGTLNVGHCLPTLAQALIYINVVEVEAATLISLIAASVLGSWLGAGVVTRLSRRWIQLGMGTALLVAAGFFLTKLLDKNPTGGTALALEGPWLAVGIAGNFIFGALMTIGVGAYAPIMAMVALMGMDPKAAFPIMMGSCAFLMPVCGVRFIRSGAYDAKAALGLTLAGIPAVCLAAFWVKELDLEQLRWIVLFVLVFTAVTLLRAAKREWRLASGMRGPAAEDDADA